MVVCKIIYRVGDLGVAMVVLQRSEAEEVREQPSWVLLFGRRKVGKTFLVRNFLEWDVYVMVRRDGVSIAEGLDVGWIEDPRALSGAVGRALGEGRTVVVDEFQRLPEWFLDEVSLHHPSGKLILSGSSMRVVDKVLGSRSPLLALVFPYRLDLVRPRDVLVSLGEMDPARAIEFGAFLREPWLTQLVRGWKDVERELYRTLSTARFAVPALVGEVFVESERSMSRVYEALIRGMGGGLWRPGDLAHRLTNTGLIGTEGSNYIREYLHNLETMGLVTSIPLFRKARMKAYRLTSSFMETYYYIADRHQTDEVDRPFGEVRENLRKMVAQAVERFVGRAFADLEDGQLECSFDPELDLVVTGGRERRPVVVGEVKWGRYDAGDVRTFAAKVEDLRCRKVFLCRDVVEAERVGEVEVMGPADLVRTVTGDLSP